MSLEECQTKPRGTHARESSSSSRDRKRPSKPNAIAFVEGLEIDDHEKKEALLLLAKGFEKKTFMPNANSVRAFLAQQGQDASKIKSRQQALTSVFKCLAAWETRKIHELHKRGTFGTPKSLSVIAKSIENFGQQNRH